MVDILLATYNGEKYIKEQLESLLNQTFKDIRILIRDDGSADDTINIINGYAHKYPQMITVVKDENKCGCAAANFMQLIQSATSEYIMFCDQDDFWLPNKVEKMLSRMKEEEAKCGANCPILLFSELTVVDDTLQATGVDNSKMGFFDAKKMDLPHLLVQSYVPGCVMMVNKSMYKKLHSYSPQIMMHDWWIQIYASVFGKIIHMKEELMLYRQHSNNTVGAVDVKSIKYRMKKMFSKDTKSLLNKYCAQAEYFYKLYEQDISEGNKIIFDKFVSLPQKWKLLRIYIMFRYKFLKNDFARILGQILFF